MTTTVLELPTDIEPVNRPAARAGRGWAGKQMLIFDLIGPLVAYKIARDQGIDTVGALLISSVLPLVGLAIDVARERRIDLIGVIALISTGLGGVLSLIVDSPQPTLIFTSVLPTLTFAIGCLISLRGTPLIFRFALAMMGGRETAKGAEFASRWDTQPGFRRYFGRVTAAWGIAYVLEAGVKIVIILHSSTGHALASVSLLSTGIAIGLSVWTAVYGNIARRRGTAVVR